MDDTEGDEGAQQGGEGVQREDTGGGLMSNSSEDNLPQGMECVQGIHGHCRNLVSAEEAPEGFMDVEDPMDINDEDLMDIDG
ncbi:hypothetical protein ETB97_002448 [Aspergillus alliaceus]|uniref:Uncharacterized protein n=1 Tax=Petromyces alliaceus TaxID=209559 RepID=A0A8H6E6A0_PETAA|nr:hypothetical protein ETB97_002448 [Aspergillus burnettii]